MAIRRETLIALRARRTAYQITQSIINPHLDVPPPPAPVAAPNPAAFDPEIPVFIDDWTAIPHLSALGILAVVAVISCCAVVGYLLNGWLFASGLIPL